MDKVTKDIGPVSAYALAVAHGYTGTEEEWARLQMESGVNAQRAESAANSAEASAQRADAQAANAENSARSAQDAASSAEASRAEAANQASSAKTSANQAENSATNAASSAEAAAAAEAAAEASAARSETAADRAEAAAQSQAQIDDAVASFSKVWSSKRTLDRLCPAFEANGGMVSCHPVEGYPLGVKSRIVAVQTGEGDPSPDNIRPIMGWNAASLTRCGKNLFSNDVNRVQQIDMKNSSGGDITRWGYVLDLPAGNYVIKGEYKENNLKYEIYALVVYKDNKQHNGTPAINPLAYGILGKATAFTVGRGEQLVIHSGSATDIANSIIRFGKLNLYIFADDGNTESVPYQGDTYTTQFPETIYGGEYDWVTGVLTVTHDKDNGTGEIYELAEPYIVQLEPQTIPAISGLNNLWSDTGETSVTGRSDPVYIMGQIEDRLTALEAVLVSG